MFLSIPKCKSITFTKKINPIDFSYTIGNHSLEKVSNIRDLGVTLDSKLHLDMHINNITSKAYQMMGFVLRSCSQFRLASTYLLLYFSLVRSQLEYSVPVWNPLYIKYSNKVEWIQKKFLSIMHGRIYRTRLPYPLLLQVYSILSLKKRRTLLETATLYKICNNHLDCPTLLNQINIHVPSRSTRKNDLFQIDLVRTNAGERAPMRRLCETYNQLFFSLDIHFLSAASYKKKALEILRQDSPWDLSHMYVYVTLFYLFIYFACNARVRTRGDVQYVNWEFAVFV